MQVSDTIITGVDIGGSHITAAAIDTQQGCIVPGSKREAKIDCDAAAEVILTDWTSVINEVQGCFPDLNMKIGISMPGPFDYKNGISLIKGFNKYEALYKINVKAYLSEATGISTSNIRFRNDAEAFLLGEVCFGSAKGFNRAVGITLGTGTGTSVCKDGKCWDAERSVTFLNEGIVEDYLSTRWFTKEYNLRTGKKIKDVKALCLLAGKEAIADELFNEFSANMAQFLARFIGEEDPGVIIVGGNIGRAHEFFLPKVRQILSGQNIDIPIRLTELWEEAALMGATYQINNGF